MYRLWGAKSVNDAYDELFGIGVGGTGPTAMQTIPKDTMGQSATVIRRNWHVEEVRKDQTSFQFDPDDYVTPAIPPPFRGDDFPVYVRLQEHRAGQWLAVPAGAVHNANEPIRGPILVVPSVNFFASSVSGSISFAGIAPAGTGCTSGNPPVVDSTVQTALPMHIIFPKTCSSIRITAEVSGKTVLISRNLYEPMIPIQNTNPFQLDDDSNRGINEIVLAASVEAASFTIYATMAHVM
jgi:hypothetical protein